MKQRSLLFIIVMLLSVTMYTQIPIVSAVPKVDLGLKAGLNYEQLNGNGVTSDYNPGFQGGIFVGLRKKSIGVQVEGLVSFAKYTLQDSLSHGAFRATYINIPVLFEYKVIPHLWLQVGPQYSGIVSVKSLDAFSGDAKELFKSGAIAGVAGLEIKLLHIAIGARYVFGLSNLNNYGSDAWKQRSFQIHAGFSFL